jgi:hypothetical protein
MSKDSSSKDIIWKNPDDYYKENIHWGPIWSVFLTVLIYFISQIITILVLSLIFHFMHWSSKRSNDWLSSSVVGQFFSVLLVEFLSLGTIYVFLKWKKSSFKKIGIVKFKLRDIFAALSGFLIYMVSFYALALILGALIKSFNIDQQQNVGFQSVNGNFGLFLAFISLVILPPIAEEIIFRGFLFSGLRTKMKFIYAAIITSLIFAVPHLVESKDGGILWIAGLDTFILSMVSSALREKTRGLWSSILLHSFKNGVAFIGIFLIH